MESDTIVAISTPPGRGAIGMVRISGSASREIAERMCPGVSRWIERRALHASLRSMEGAMLDDAVVTFYEGPRSYSGEDMVEISCHGSPVILSKVVETVLALGARAARPGEFTLRAFAGGKLDLAQAEAVVDLVQARTEAGAGLALMQLEGELSRRIEPIRSSLLDMLAHITALVDFAEEDIPEIVAGEIRTGMAESRMLIEDLLEGARRGQVLSHGVSLAIVGPPNAGKSSILNGLLKRDRAIVTPIPGTTRDTIEEEADIEGALVRMVDTAGITETEDTVEAIGVERSQMALVQADLVLVVVDSGSGLTEANEVTLRRIRTSAPEGRFILAFNKVDMPEAISRGIVSELVKPEAVVDTYALSMDGLNHLRETIVSLTGVGESDGFVVSGQRHVESLRKASAALERAVLAEQEGVPLDLVSVDLREAVIALGEILGIEIGDEVLDRVFSRFCIGK